MLRDVWVVYRKELREVLRDRRALVFMVLLPTLIMPLIMSLTVEYLGDAQRKAASETLTYAVFGEEHAPGLAAALPESEGFARAEVGDFDEALARIENGELKFALVAKPPEAERLVLELHYDNAVALQTVDKRVRGAVARLADTQRSAKLSGLGLASPHAQQAVTDPIDLRVRGVAPQREEIGEAVGGVLPYLLIVFGFLGALYPATDLGAGEKERGTLETLLLAPVPRARLVLGKYLVIFTTSAAAAVLGVASLGIWLAAQDETLGGAFGEVFAAVTAADLVLVAALLIPVAGIIAALLLSVSIYAKTFKEAQAYMGPLNLLLLMPAFFAMLPGVTLDWHTALVPLTGVALCIKEIAKGTLDPALYVLCFAGAAVLAAGMLALCTRMFSRESVVFR